MKISRFFLNLRDLPKSLYFNLKVFPVKTALHFPIWLRYDTELCGSFTKGCIVLQGGAHSKRVTVGIYGSPGIAKGTKASLVIQNGGILKFDGTANICEGCTVRADGGEIQFGDNFYMNSNSIIWSNQKIAFGANVVLGYDVYIRDDDGHFMIRDGVKQMKAKPISIGNHVWIGAYAKILKGVSLGDDTVVAMGSYVTKCFGSNVTVAGIPAKEIQQHTNWTL